MSAILRPVSVKNAPATADAKFRGNSVDAADGKAERDVPSTSPIAAEYVGSSRHLIADQMFSLLQLESDGSDSNSIKMNSKVKSKVKKSKEITILDAIIGLKNAHSKSIGSESKDRNCQNKEKSYLQRKNEALEEYMGPAAQVIPINKDQRKTVFKDNTTLLQTVKVCAVLLFIEEGGNDSVRFSSLLLGARCPSISVSAHLSVRLSG